MTRFDCNVKENYVCDIIKEAANTTTNVDTDSLVLKSKEEEYNWFNVLVSDVDF